MNEPENEHHEGFGPYRLLHKLGVGGMGVVHLAELVGEAGFRKRVVIKRMHPHYQSDQRLVELFATEARTNARIDHPNVVHVLEFGLEPEPYIVMEFIDGVSLWDVLYRYNQNHWDFDIRASTLIAAEAALGLDFAHRMTDEHGVPLGIIHRDVSPSNILISCEGAVKVSDFGLVMVADDPFTSRDNTPVGKLSYMAPEQARGDTLDIRADVFALGLVLWESLTRRRLLSSEDQQAIYGMLEACIFPPPSRFNPYVPPELDWIVMACLQKNPNDRWTSADALSAALRQLLHTRGRGFDRVQLSYLIRGAFPEKGWDPKLPGQPPPKPTKSQIALLHDARGTEMAAQDGGSSKQPQTSPGPPQALFNERVSPITELEQAAEPPQVFGVSYSRSRPIAGTDQFLIAQLERSMWVLQTSRPLRDGARLRGSSQGQLLMVVDGIGDGAPGIQLGSVAIDVFAHYTLGVMPWAAPRSDNEIRRFGEGLLDAARGCGTRLATLAASRGASDLARDVSFTTTYLLWPDLFVVQFGTTRSFLYRDLRIWEIAGKSGDPEVDQQRVGRVLITSSDSEDEGLPNQVMHLELQEGDALLLCTDGLTRWVTASRIEQEIHTLDLSDVETCTRALAGLAGLAGTDDVTVVLARY